MSTTNTNSNQQQLQQFQRFADKVILVLALEFAREGALLVLSGRAENKLIETAKLFKDQFNGKSVYHGGDTSSSEEVNKQLVETT